MSTHVRKSSKREFKTFGWQGIALTIPADWEMVSLGGDNRSGYVSLADENAVRLELRWRPAEKREDPSDAVSIYLKRLRKKAKKQRLDVDVRRDLKLANPKGKEVECYGWKADGQAVGMVSKCEECHRLVHLHLLGRTDESLSGLARTLFGSLRDHSSDGNLLWRFYDLKFETPTGFSLHTKLLKTGCIRMRFVKRRRMLEFARVSLARIVLNDTSLEQWFREFYRGVLKKYRCRFRDVKVKGHPGCRAEGRASLLRNPLAFLGPRRRLEAASWHCENTNRLFLCSYIAPSGEAQVLEDVLQDFVCCERG